MCVVVFVGLAAKFAYFVSCVCVVVVCVCVVLRLLVCLSMRVVFWL